MTKRYTIGVDECGRGAWAGPLVVCAFAKPEDEGLPKGVRDSKQFKTVKQRRERDALASLLEKWPHTLYVASAGTVDEWGIELAWATACRTAVQIVHQLVTNLDGMVLEVTVDGRINPLEACPVPSHALPDADSLLPEVSAASIMAKSLHDLRMAQLDVRHPGYGFAKNMGYGGSKAHRTGLQLLGLCPEHRRSYEPMKSMAEERAPKVLAPILPRA